MVLLKSHRRRGGRKLEGFDGVVELVGARGAQPGNRDGAGLQNDAVCRFQITVAFEDGAVLFQRQVKAVGQRQRFRKPIRHVRYWARIRRAKARDGNKKGNDK